MNAPIIKIDWLPVVVAFGRGGDGRVESGWRFIPPVDDRDKEGLRIEIVTYTWDGEVPQKERHEVRLVKGPLSDPKHLHVIKIRKWNAWRLGDAVFQLRQEFFAKGW